ncbi:MAG: Zn-dependent hydrolase [Alteromonadaceae bacterium]|nr:Zn-dependent hydrolase [Alteromonadaceae bacterium]
MTLNERNQLRINKTRLWSTLMDMAQIGATAKGGCNRQALTALDKAGRELFISWCREIGCEIRWDEIGNLFARYPGTDPNAGTILMSSHLDTQPTGGKFDGVYGVLGGLEVLRTLHDNQLTSRHPLEVAAWTNEEGARFTPACMGSGVWSGNLNLDSMLRVTDKDGISVAEALESCSYKGTIKAAPHNVSAAIELHIEQGPVLEKQNKEVGIVTGIQGLRWFTVTLTGIPCHAGPTPMEDRTDPVQPMAEIIKAAYAIAAENAPASRATIGEIITLPGSPNTVPETVVIRIDLRHQNAEIMNNMDRLFRQQVARICNEYAVDYALEEKWRMEVTSFNSTCISAVEEASALVGVSAMPIVSGAGHDSLYLSQRVPTSMIFIPCKNGISHNEAESITPEQAENGANVLLHTVLKLANN